MQQICPNQRWHQPTGTHFWHGKISYCMYCQHEFLKTKLKELNWAVIASMLTNQKKKKKAKQAHIDLFDWQDASGKYSANYSTHLFWKIHCINMIICLFSALPSCSAGQELSDLQLQIWQWEETHDLWVLHWEPHPHSLLSQVSPSLICTLYCAQLHKWTNWYVLFHCTLQPCVVSPQGKIRSYQCCKTGTESGWGFCSQWQSLWPQ